MEHEAKNIDYVKYYHDQFEDLLSKLDMTDKEHDWRALVLCSELLGYIKGVETISYRRVSC